MTLQQLEYLLALDKHRNFVKAADSCFVTQPTLTMQLRKLEDEYGFQLFNRTEKPLQPTKNGVIFIEKAQEILSIVGELRSLMKSNTENIEGEFKIGIIPTLAPYILPRFLPSFIKEFPQSRLHIQELQSEQIIEKLKQNLIDIAIIVTPLQENSLREIPVCDETFLIYLPENSPLIHKKTLSVADLESFDLLLLEEGHCFRNQALNICSSIKREEYPFIYQSGSIETLKSLVDKGLGYTLVPELSVKGTDDLSRIKRFVSPEPSREISLVVAKSFHREVLLDHIRKVMQKNLPEAMIKNKPRVRINWRTK